METNKIDELELKEAIMSDRGVEIEIGFTKSMGKGTYEFLRVDTRYKDVPEEGESLDDLADRLYTALEAKVVEKVAEICDELGPRDDGSNIHAE